MSECVHISYFPRHTGLGGGRGCHFSFGLEGGCQKILYDVGGPGILKKLPL